MILQVKGILDYWFDSVSLLLYGESYSFDILWSNALVDDVVRMFVIHLFTLFVVIFSVYIFFKSLIWLFNLFGG